MERGSGAALVAASDRVTMLVVVGCFLLMLLGMGWVFRHFSRDTSDYFRAGGRATWWILGGSLFMQGFSAWTFTGAAGAAFAAGWRTCIAAWRPPRWTICSGTS